MVFPSRITDPARLSSIALAAAELTPPEETATIISWPTWPRRPSEEASSEQRGVAGADRVCEAGVPEADGTGPDPDLLAGAVGTPVVGPIGVAVLVGTTPPGVVA